MYTSYDSDLGIFGGIVEVVAGISNNDHVEIISGLNEGDTVYYVESEDELMQNLKGIAEKLAKLDGSRKQIAELLIDDGFYEGGDAEALAKILEMNNPYVDLDDGELIVCFDAGTNDGYMKDFVNIELFGDIFEITGWVT